MLKAKLDRALELAAAAPQRLGAEFPRKPHLFHHRGRRVAASASASAASTAASASAAPRAFGRPLGGRARRAAP